MSDANDENERKFSKDERELISRLRDEASSVKDCFTKFAFQSITLSAAGLAVLSKYQMSEPFFGLISIFVILIVLCVARIGTYKYASANRHYGYELCLDRLSRFNENSKWKPSIKDIGWEESIRAWRIVQTTVFEYLYTHGKWTPNKLKEKHTNLNYPWFEPNTLIPSEYRKDKGVIYYGGSYLKTMQSIFFTIVYFSLMFLLAVPVQSYFKYGNKYLYADTVVGVIIFFTVLIITVLFIRKLKARRILLEEGLLSIHSCAIMWNLVIIAHCRALNKLWADKDGQLTSLKGYTPALSELAIELTEYITEKRNIEEWVNKESEARPDRRASQIDCPGMPERRLTAYKYN